MSCSLSVFFYGHELSLHCCISLHTSFIYFSEGIGVFKIRLTLSGLWNMSYVSLFSLGGLCDVTLALMHILHKFETTAPCSAAASAPLSDVMVRELVQPVFSPPALAFMQHLHCSRRHICKLVPLRMTFLSLPHACLVFPVIIIACYNCL